MKLNRTQVETILKNAPVGADKREILNGLISRGYELEGVDTNLAKQQIAQKQQTVEQPESEDKGVVGTLLGPLNEGVEGLKTLYGGGEQGIAMKLKRNIEEGASDIQKGIERTGAAEGVKGIAGIKERFAGGFDVLKGVAKSGLRSAGDVAGAIYAPIGAAIGATGIGKVFSGLQNRIEDQAMNNPDNIIYKLTQNKAVQDFATNHPNAGEDFQRALSLAFAAKQSTTPGGQIDPKTVIPRTAQQIQGVTNKVTAPFNSTVETIRNKTGISGVQNKPIEQLRSEKVTSGYMDQNARIKSVNKAFNENTKTYKNPDGTITKVTPVETLSKHNIKPNIDKGTIDMGSYEQGTGGLGKIKSLVGGIDDSIDAKLAATGKSTSLKSFQDMVVKEITKNPNLKRTGTVQTTLNKVDGVFKDYQQSYGNKIGINEINAIRKAMNNTFNQETFDVNRAVGNAGRKIVYNATPDKVVRDLLRQQGELLDAVDYSKALHGTKVSGGRIGNYAMRTGGAVVGSTVKNLPVVGPVLGMLGGEYLARAMQQSQFTSFPAEIRAAIPKLQSILQRSNKAQPSQSAKIIPNKANNIQAKSNTNPLFGKENSSLTAKNKITDSQLKNSEIRAKGGYEGSVEQSIEQSLGWVEGLKVVFDTALGRKDALTVRALLPYVPKEYQIRFAKEINSILNK